MTTNQATIFWGVLVILMAAGMLWAWLAINEIGWLEGIERLGLRIAAWARAQKTARLLYRATYASYRKSAAIADQAIQQQEG